ncbi:hypothetical protein CA54_50790 [Symmachiella macrocystis]|uniref:DUF6677 domain-containing protein n=1 Tax=Symmachiella macrocystis TaxID=2527985 RepID=A0A5C6B441_9PLAN|nr:DUF6677 family protein [Symmachiella macrocystis]TWU06680.1 hypothetical protein CA54_50790 [Symmachiella macrocystis]
MAETPQIQLRDPRVAAILAFLVPGLGHFYQRRTFKGVLYSVCILGTFFTGMYLSDWTVVYINWGKKDRIIPQACQVWNGLAFLPAVIQARRVDKIADPRILNEPAAGHFSGKLSDVTSSVELDGHIAGELQIEPVGTGFGRGYSGKFIGVFAGKHPIQGTVDGGSIDPKIAPFRERRLTFDLKGTVDFDGQDLEFNGLASGGMQRSIADWYAAPLHDDSRIYSPTDLETANNELGRYFELGTLYTMIAGLLNVLAIYDAYEGPAYGDGEDDDEEKPDKDVNTDKESEAPAPAK